MRMLGAPSLVLLSILLFPFGSAQGQPARGQTTRALPAQLQQLASGQTTVSAEGEVRHGGLSLGRLELPPAPRGLAVATVEVAGHKLLHVRVSEVSKQPAAKAMKSGAAGGAGPRRAEPGEATRSTRRAAELLVELRDKPETIFRGTTGPQGVDAEWSQHLEVSSSGVLLFQRREGVYRCDQAPPRLFVKLYDFASRRFRPASAAVHAEGLPTLVATRTPKGAPAGDPLNTFRLIAASTLAEDEGEARNLSAPVQAEDGKAATAWSESLGGDGRGEFLTAQGQPSSYKLRAVKIIPGDAASARAFRQSNRLKSAVLLVGSNRSYRVVLPRDPLTDRGSFADPYWVLLPEPAAATCVTLVIAEVYPAEGAPKGDGRTALSEVQFFTELEFAGGLPQLRRDLDATEQRQADGAVTVLSRLGVQAVRLIEEDLSTATGLGLERRVRVLIRTRVPESAPPLARALTRLEAPMRPAVLEALVQLGAQPAVAALVPLLKGGGKDEASPAVRAEVARTLGQIGGSEAKQALLEHAGRGTDEVRAGVVAGLGILQGPDDREAVLSAAADSRDVKRRADLIYALARLGQSDPQKAAASVAALWASSPEFEVRYRIIGTVARLDAEGQLSLLGQAAGDPDPVLRWLALEKIALVRGAAATAYLRRGLRDGSPQVRLTAAVGLAKRRSDAESGRALARLLESERWTMVQLAVAEALGSHCVPESLKALRHAVSSAPEGVDENALLSLARCNPPGLASELIALARKPDRRANLRSRALSLLSPAQARSNADALIAAFSELRQNAPARSEDEVVALSAAGALALAGGRQAAEALADALALDPHETIRRAAALGLGRICEPSAAETLRRGRSDASDGVRRAAAESCKRCGIR